MVLAAALEGCGRQAGQGADGSTALTTSLAAIVKVAPAEELHDVDANRQHIVGGFEGRFRRSQPSAHRRHLTTTPRHLPPHLSDTLGPVLGLPPR